MNIKLPLDDAIGQPGRCDSLGERLSEQMTRRARLPRFALHFGRFPISPSRVIRLVVLGLCVVRYCVRLHTLFKAFLWSGSSGVYA